METRAVRWLMVVVLALLLAACGDDGDESESDDDPATTTAAPDDDTGDDDSADDDTGDDDAPATTAPPADEAGEDSSAESGDAPAVGEMGSFIVNDTEYAVTFLNRCIPFEGEDSGIVDLQPIAQGQGAQLNLYGDGGDFDEVSVQGSGIEEMFGSISFSTLEATESNLDGDRWTGSATLDDALDTADPVSVAWDVMVPAEVQDCGL